MTAKAPTGKYATQALYLLGALIPAAAYWLFLLGNTANAPYHDDLYDILFTWIQQRDAASTQEAWRALFWQYNQHFLFLNRLLYRCLNWQGAIDFRTIIIIGNLGFSLFFLQLCCSTNSSNRHAMPIMAAVFFNLYMEENSFWAMAAVQQLAIMSLTYGCLQLLYQPDCNKPWRTLAACACCWIAIFTQANETLLIPLGTLLLFGLRLRTRSLATAGNLLLWLISCVLCLLLFLRLQNITSMNAFLENSTRYETGWRDIAISFIASLASLPFRPADNPAHGLIPGLIQCFLLVWLLMKNWRRQPVICLMLLFCTLSLLSAAITRTPFYGPSAFVSRYKVFTTTLVCLEILLLTHMFPGKRLGIPLAVLAVAANLHSYYINAKYIEYQKFRREEVAIAWFYTGNIMAFPLSAEILDDAYTMGLYNPLQATGAAATLTIAEQNTGCPDATSDIVMPPVASTPYSRAAMLARNGALDNARALWFCGQRTYRATAIPARHVNPRLHKLFAVLEKNRLAPDSYRMLIETNDNQMLSSATTFDNTTHSALPHADCSNHADTLNQLFQPVRNRYCRSSKD